MIDFSTKNSFNHFNQESKAEEQFLNGWSYYSNCKKLIGRSKELSFLLKHYAYVYKKGKHFFYIIFSSYENPKNLRAKYFPDSHQIYGPLCLELAQIMLDFSVFFFSFFYEAKRGVSRA